MAEVGRERERGGKRGARVDRELREEEVEV